MTKRSDRRTALVRYGPVILWALVIFCLSSIPNLSAPGSSFRILDKIAHFVEFGILGYLLMSAFASSRRTFPRTRIIAVLLVGISYSVLDEMHQSLVPGREMDFYDILADLFGVCLAVVLWIVLRRRKLSISH